MDKLNWFYVCLRAYEKAQRTERSYEKAMNEWLLYESELIDNGQLEEFSRFYKNQHENDVAEWNRLIAKREKELKG